MVDSALNSGVHESESSCTIGMSVIVSVVVGNGP